MRVVVACVTLAVVVPVASAHAASATNLGNGFTVLPGSRLVGPTTFPVAAYDPFRASPSSWTALLEVTGPASTVYDAYAAHARALGYDVEWSTPACSGGQTPTITDVTCGSSSTGTTDTVSLGLRVCGTCAVPVSAMTITYVRGAKPQRRSPLPAIPPPANAFLVLQLDPAQRGAARASLVHFDERLGWPSPALGTGDRALASSDFGGCARGEIVTVVSARGDAAAVFRRYVSVMPYEVPIKKTTAEFHGRPTRLAHSDFGVLTVVEGSKGHSLVMITDCDD
ncbi:MAG TPA: hypothetical protein VGN51_07655 [Acidimicrobiia bacterium]|jgi:hypothetical protein